MTELLSMVDRMSGALRGGVALGVAIFRGWFGDDDGEGRSQQKEPAVGGGLPPRRGRPPAAVPKVIEGYRPSSLHVGYCRRKGPETTRCHDGPRFDPNRLTQGRLSRLSRRMRTRRSVSSRDSS